MSDLIEEFLDAKSVEDGVSINTLQAYRRDIKQFIDVLSPIKIENVCDEDRNLFRQNTDLSLLDKKVGDKKPYSFDFRVREINVNEVTIQSLKWSFEFAFKRILLSFLFNL